MDRMDRRTKLIVAGCILALLAGVTAAVAGRANAAVKPADFKAYPVPCKQCHYTADHRETVDYTATRSTGTGNGGAGGWRQQRWEMLTGFTSFRISKVGRTHVVSGEWLGQDEYGPHAFNQVAFYVRRATPAGSKPVPPRIVGGKIQDPLRVTKVHWFPRFAVSGRVNVSKENGETLQGLEGVFVADNRGTPLVTVVRPDDVPFAGRVQ
jgi:hypothetical protein